MEIRKVKYPSWHDDARALHAQGVKHPELAKKYGLSASRMSHICNKKWQQYMAYNTYSFQDAKLYNGKRTIENYRDMSKYEFVRVEMPPPSETGGVSIPLNGATVVIEKERESDDMGTRFFTTVSKYDASNGRTLKGVKIWCSTCTNSTEYFDPKGTINPTFAGKNFEKAGWIVGVRAHGDICPDCQARTKLNIPSSIPSPVQSIIKEGSKMSVAIKADTALPLIANPTGIAALQKKEPLVTPEPEKEMGKTERRIVFAKLNDVYVDEATGYADDWDDAKVADDLGVPVEWVKSVRDSDFGPEISAASKNAKVKALTEMSERMMRVGLLVDKKLEQMQALDEKINAVLKEVETAVARFTELKTSLAIEDQKMQEAMTRFAEDLPALKKIYAEVHSKPSA